MLFNVSLNNSMFQIQNEDIYLARLMQEPNVGIKFRVRQKTVDKK